MSLSPKLREDSPTATYEQQLMPVFLDLVKTTQPFGNRHSERYSLRCGKTE